VKDINLIQRDRKRDNCKEGNVRQLFEEEGYELALIAYMKKTGIDYRVDPEQNYVVEDEDDPPGNLRRYPEDIPSDVD
jgi:hypothetical protein